MLHEHILCVKILLKKKYQIDNIESTAATNEANDEKTAMQTWVSTFFLS